MTFEIRLWLLGMVMGGFIGAGLLIIGNQWTAWRLKQQTNEAAARRQRERFDQMMEHTGHHLSVEQERLRRLGKPEEVTRVSVRCEDCEVLVDGTLIDNPDRWWEEEG